MPMNNLIEYSDNYSKTCGSLWQYCIDIPAVNNNVEIAEFNGGNATDSFNFWRTLEIPLINCEINLILTWSANCVIIYTDVANQGGAFAITETKLCSCSCSEFMNSR